LLRPVNSLFLGAFRSVNVLSIFNAGCGMALAIYAIIHGSLHLNVLDVTVWLGYLLLGATTVVMFGVLIMSMGFWTIQTQPLVWLFFECYRLAFRPDDLYSAWLRRILVSVFPAAFFVSIPVRLALHKTEGWIWYIAPVAITLMMSTLAVTTWNRGVKKYEGALS